MTTVEHMEQILCLTSCLLGKFHPPDQRGIPHLMNSVFVARLPEKRSVSRAFVIPETEQFIAADLHVINYNAVPLWKDSALC
jgi:hypothetical protein